MILRLVEIALHAHEDWFGATVGPIGGDLPDSVRTLGDLAAHWAMRLHGAPGDTLPGLFATMGISSEQPFPDDAQGRHDYSTIALAMAALSPQFLYR